MFSVIEIVNPAMLALQPVNAVNLAEGWGHIADETDTTEINWESTVTYYIDQYFGTANWNHENNYWTSTTSTNVLNKLSWIQSNPIDKAATWWVGDFVPSSGTPRHYGFNGYNYQHIWDNDIRTAIGYNSKQNFNFIWTCVNGGLQWSNGLGAQNDIAGITSGATSIINPPPTNTNTYYGHILTYPYSGIVGIPLALTGTFGMSINGYTNSDSGNYCYIGFENQSPFVKETPPSGWTTTNYIYAYFPYFFYRFALGIDNQGVHGTVKQSLDYAARTAFGTDSNGQPYTFGTCQLNNGYWFNGGSYGYWYCRLRVFGNANMILP